MGEVIQGYFPKSAGYQCKAEALDGIVRITIFLDGDKVASFDTSPDLLLPILVEAKRQELHT